MEEQNRCIREQSRQFALGGRVHASECLAVHVAVNGLAVLEEFDEYGTSDVEEDGEHRLALTRSDAGFL